LEAARRMRLQFVVSKRVTTFTSPDSRL